MIEPPIFNQHRREDDGALGPQTVLRNSLDIQRLSEGQRSIECAVDKLEHKMDAHSASFVEFVGVYNQDKAFMRSVRRGFGVTALGGGFALGLVKVSWRHIWQAGRHFFGVG